MFRYTYTYEGFARPFLSGDDEGRPVKVTFTLIGPSNLNLSDEDTRAISSATIEENGRTLRANPYGLAPFGGPDGNNKVTVSLNPDGSPKLVRIKAADADGVSELWYEPESGFPGITPPKGTWSATKSPTQAVYMEYDNSDPVSLGRVRNKDPRERSSEEPVMYSHDPTEFIPSEYRERLSQDTQDFFDEYNIDVVDKKPSGGKFITKFIGAKREDHPLAEFGHVKEDTLGVATQGEVDNVKSDGVGFVFLDKIEGCATATEYKRELKVTVHEIAHPLGAHDTEGDLDDVMHHADTSCPSIGAAILRVGQTARELVQPLTGREVVPITQKGEQKKQILSEVLEEAVGIRGDSEEPVVFGEEAIERSPALEPIRATSSRDTVGIEITNNTGRYLEEVRLSLLPGAGGIEMFSVDSVATSESKVVDVPRAFLADIVVAGAECDTCNYSVFSSPNGLTSVSGVPPVRELISPLGDESGLYEELTIPAVGLVESTWQPTGSFSLRVIEESIAGDFNEDGKVDNADLSLLLGSWGASTVPSEWTGAFSSPVDNDELSDLLGGWGSGIAAVPEPSALAMLLVTATAALRRYAT